MMLRSAELLSIVGRGWKEVATTSGSIVLIRSPQLRASDAHGRGGSALHSPNLAEGLRTSSHRRRDSIQPRR